MRYLDAGLTGCAVLLVAGSAYGQRQQVTPSGAVVDAVVTWCASSTGTATVCAGGGGGGGSTGSVTAAGTNGTLAQAIQGITGGVPVPITGSINATNPSVGTGGSTAPTSDTLMGIMVGSLLQPVSASNPVPVSGTVTLGAGSAAVGTVALGAGSAAVGTVTTTPKAGTFAASGCTVGTTSAQCLAAGTPNHVLVQDTSATASLACAWGATAALNSATSFQLAPGQSYLCGPQTAGCSTSALNCIASAASTPAYVENN